MIGTRLGAYTLLEEIGAGGMATVYRAVQEKVGRDVAVKVIGRHILQDPTALERFQREAQVIARLEHPHILPVYDYDLTTDPPFIVMRYLPTGTLKEILRREWLPADELAVLFRQIASALDYAHRQGIVHRDVKPSNILVDGEGNAFLVDFGLARMVESAQSTGITASGTTVGTPDYMSPEQVMGMPIDGRSDIYGLGVMLFEMLTGQMPFAADTPIAVVFKHVQEPVPSVMTINPELPEAIDVVIGRAMAKEPDARYQTCLELHQALCSALEADGTVEPVRLRQAAQQTILEIEQRQARAAARKAAAQPAAHPPAPTIRQERPTRVEDVPRQEQPARREQPAVQAPRQAAQRPRRTARPRKQPVQQSRRQSAEQWVEQAPAKPARRWGRTRRMDAPQPLPLTDGAYVFGSSPPVQPVAVPQPPARAWSRRGLLEPLLVLNGGLSAGCLSLLLTAGVIGVIAFLAAGETVTRLLRSTGDLTMTESLPVPAVIGIVGTALLLVTQAIVGNAVDVVELVPRLWAALGYPGDVGTIVQREVSRVGDIGWLVLLVFLGGWLALAFLMVFLRARANRTLHWILSTVGLWVLSVAAVALGLALYRAVFG